MEPIGIISLITTVIPFVTTVVKKVIRTDKLSDKSRKGVNALIPVIIGIVSSGIFAFSQGSDWVTALAIGLGSGGAASSARDIEKNLVRLVSSVGTLLKNKGNLPG